MRLPIGRLAGIRAIRQYFIHHDLRAAGLVVFFGERAALQQLRAHRLEIAGKHDQRIGRLKFARVCKRFLGAPANRAVPTCKRKWTCGGYALHSGNGAQALFELASV